jgi:hypothetical protein
MTSDAPPTQPLALPLLRRRGLLLGVLGFAGIAVVIGFVSLLPAWFYALPLSSRRLSLVFVVRAALACYALVLVSVTLLVIGIIANLASRNHRRAIRFGLFVVATSSFLVGSEAAAWCWGRLTTPGHPIRPNFAKIDDKELNVVVVGSSTALGYPYSPQVSLGQIFAWQLERAYPGRRVRCEILADLGLTIEAAVLRLGMLRKKPDYLIIVCGTTEFSARFKPERRVDFDEEPRETWLVPIYRISLHSPLFRGLYRVLRPHWEEQQWGEPVKNRLADDPWLTPSERADILDGFAFKLGQVLDFAERSGCQTVLVLPPSNEGDFEPNRSVLAPWRSSAERETITREFQEARALELQDSFQSRAAYIQLIARAPELAEPHFRLGRLLEIAGLIDDSRDHYRAACDLDGMPTRFNSELAALCRKAARGRADVRVVDGRLEFLRHSLKATIDDNLMLDGPHPSLRGTVVLARAVLRAFDLEQQPTRLQPSDVISQFELNNDAWLRAARWGRDYYAMWTKVRFEPSERIEKRSRFEEIVHRLEAGTAIEEIDFAPLRVDALKD